MDDELHSETTNPEMPSSVSAEPNGIGPKETEKQETAATSPDAPAGEPAPEAAAGPDGEENKEAPAETEGGAPQKKFFQRPAPWVILAVIAAAGIWFLSSHVLFAGNAIPKSAGEVDLRQQEITAEQYLSLAEKLPDADIHWNVPLSTGTQDSHARSLTLSALTGEDVELLTLFPRLRSVELTEDFADYPQALALARALPEADVSWTVELGGKRWNNDSAALTLDTASVTTDELTEKLAWLPETETITFTGDPLPYERMDALAKAFPGVKTISDLELCGTVFSSEAEELSFAGRTDITETELDAIRSNAFRFPNLTAVDLTDCGLEDEALVELASALGKDVVWTTHAYGFPVCSTDTQIDVSYRRVYDGGARIEELIPGMHHLEKVVMLECGLSDEEMDALNKKYDDVRFVWMVHFGGYQMRSDETAFIAAKWEKGYLFNDTIAPIRYCTDLIALDMGHQKFTDLSFLYEMPHLRFLILADGYVNDITAIASLQELEYLELFQSQVTDLSPLLQCKNLKDLNISYIPYAAADSAYEVLLQTTWLERLFYFGTPWSQQQQDTVRDAYPDSAEVVFYNGLESTGLDWRYHERYYEMRDLLEMYYMPGGTNGEDDDK